MSSHDIHVRLQHMRDYAQSLVDAVNGKTLAGFPAGNLATDGLIRRLEIIGEAASHVPPEDQAHYPTIPWQGVIGLRNRMIHGYDTVNLDRVWQVIHEDLPPLLAARKRELGDIPKRT